jgi:hypothetical protein
VFRGRYGQSNGFNAVAFQAQAERRRRVGNDDKSHQKSQP